MDVSRRHVSSHKRESSNDLPTYNDEQKIHPRRRSAPWRFLSKSIRIGGEGGLSMPLGVVLLFPLLVFIIIYMMLTRSPHSQPMFQMPGGAPPQLRKISEKYDRVFQEGCQEPDTSQPRANAAFVILARNSDLDGVIQSVKSLERHFNRWYHYPYVFLNDNEFDDTFKNTIAKYTSGELEFGVVGKDMWGIPEWMDKDAMKEGIARQGDNAVMYGGMESYHAMCRFYSGFFYKHPLLMKYEWYWRVEPDIKYFCDITYDPFLKMMENNKTYGFTVAIQELRDTVPNVFRYASAYKRLHNLPSTSLWQMFVEPESTAKEQKYEDWQKSQNKKPPQPMKEQSKKKIQKMIADGKDPETMEGESYNMCHFWSNFEIARLDWFRSKEYEDFFEMMDHSGGFWMERWGDAPIHSLAAGALLEVSDIHYFRDFGYRHTTIQHCPANAPGKQLKREPYLEKTTESERERKAEDKIWDSWDDEKENGVGCRCRCDTDVVDVEGKEGSCIAEWVDVAGGWA